MTKSRHIWPGWLVLSTAAFVVALDQLTKRWIERTIPVGESVVPFPALKEVFTLTHFTNTGAAFGLFRGQAVLFIAIALVVALSIVVYIRYLPHDQWLVQVAIGLQLGGAIGNMIDRVRLGHVTDFIYFRRLPLINMAWPAFNVADSAIVIGVILLGWVLLRQKEEPPVDKAADVESRA